MKKVCISFLAVFMLLLLLTGCEESIISNNNTSKKTQSNTTVTNAVSKVITEVTASDAEDNKEEIVNDFVITGVEDGVSIDNNIYTITKAGEYTLTGSLNNGEVIVNVSEDDEVILLLSKTSITSLTDSPIKVTSASKVTVKSEEDTYNEINDKRSLKVEDDDTQGSAAIYSVSDLNITGKGSLVVNASYNNGIHTKDDLKIKNVTLKVTAPNNALKGNDEVKIESGNLILISTGGDGIKTDNSDISNKGNQKGNIIIEDGTINIYSACDGIDASYNVEISEAVNLTIKTSSYSDYSESVIESGGSDLYLIVPRSYYIASYRYCGYFYNDDQANGKWVQATYETMVSSGRTSYYGLIMEAPSSYENVMFYIFEGSENSLTEYKYRTCGNVINTSMNGYLLSTKTNSSGVLDGDWVNLTTSSQQGGRGGDPMGGSTNSEKTEYSSKGIKADNEIIINGGNISIEAKDDAIHSSYGVTLENGETSLGNITINNGTIEITSADDGIHADNTVTINNGYINIVKSYEGVEGNTINFKGGSVYVYGSDDGVNAKSGENTPSINVSGGYLDVTTPSGDTDGVDSNGSYYQTGGVVVIKGGSSQGSMAGSLDTDGKVKVTGGTIIAIGGICELPESSKPYVKMQRKSFTKGSYKLEKSDGSIIAEFTLSSSYQSCWICSEEFSTGNTYELTKDGSTYVSWKQSSSAQTVN